MAAIEILSKPSNGTIVVSYIPGGQGITTPTSGQEWAAGIVESMNTSDPGLTGDYATIIKITGGDAGTNTLNYVLVRGNESDVVPGNTIFYYNIFKTGWTLRSSPILSFGGGGWRSQMVGPGPLFKRTSDGKVVMLVFGRSTSNERSIGAISTTDFNTWTIENGDNPLITPSMTGWSGCTEIFASGKPHWLQSEGRWIMFVSALISGVWDVRWIKFDENFSNITYSSGSCVTGVTPPAGGSGLIAPSVEFFNGEYYMVFTARYPNVEDWAVWWAKAASVDSLSYSTSGLTNPIIPKVIGNTVVCNSSHQDAHLFFEWEGDFWLISGATARWSPSGTKGNRVYPIWKWNGSAFAPITTNGIVTPMWYNPMGANATLWGTQYTWAQDHCGGYPALYYDGVTSTVYLFMAMNNGSNTYQVAQLSRAI